MANVRFYAVRLDLRWVLLVGALLAALAVALFSLRDSPRDHPPSLAPSLPGIGASAPPGAPDADRAAVGLIPTAPTRAAL